MRTACLLICLYTVAVAWSQDEIGRELVVNGGFEADENGDRWPDGYDGDRQAVQWLEEDGNHFVRIERAEPGSGSVGQRIRIETDWFKIKVAIRVRLQRVVRGVEGWHDARVAMSFHDAAGDMVGGWPPVLYWLGWTDGWQTYEKEFLIPEGAAELRITPAMFSTTGRVDYDDFSVVLLKLRPRVEDAMLPPGVTAEWNLDQAWREETPTRGKVCLNGLWRFFPVMPSDDEQAIGRPADGTGWGYLKVPAAWPGRRVEAVRPIGPDIWELSVDWSKVDEGWYERRFTVPDDWGGRRLYVSFDMPQTAAEVFVDGRRAGVVRWPAGRVEITSLAAPGATVTLLVRVTTEPFEQERLVAMREDLVERVKAAVVFRGLVGDVFLESEPVGPRIDEVRTRPSVGGKSLGLALRLAGLDAGARYVIEAAAIRNGREEWRGRGEPFGPGDVEDGAYVCSLPWPNPVLWDFEQPNLYDLRVTLREVGGQPVDVQRTKFGFRELRIDGRDLLLNGTPVHLRALNFSGTNRHCGLADARSVRRTLARMRALGFNFIILGNYGLDPGGTASFGDLLRTADAMGFGLSFSTPHAFRTIGRAGRTLDDQWRRVAQYAVDTVGNHPSVLAYAMNHNTLGYRGDQNPDKIDGIYEYQPPDDNPGAVRSWDDRRARAAESEAFIRAADPTREVYHHQSGHCGAWHTVNIYLCWAPIQERNEWLEHWASVGVKPLFFVEWGPPHVAGWGGHRQGPFIWRNKVNSEPLAVEFGAMLNGDRAYRADPVMERYVDNYERVYARREPFHISTVLGLVWAASNETNGVELQAKYIGVNWPRLRTWGITALLPWDQGNSAYLPTTPAPDTTLSTDWSALQRPGYASDFEARTGDFFHNAAEGWKLTSLGKAYQRWNQPVIAYLGGDPADFTERSHNVAPGDRLTKQIVLINDSRRPVSGSYQWRLSLGRAPAAEGRGSIAAAVGARTKVPFNFEIPSEVKEPTLKLSIRVRIGEDEQIDELTLHVVQPQRAKTGRLALFDPSGKTAAELKRLGVAATAVQAETLLDGYTGLIIGREAVGVDNALPEIGSVLARGGRVLVMEQTEEALSKRLGFRTNDPSLRRAFVRTPGHPVLDGLDNPRLEDWRGDATLIPGRLDLPEHERSDPLHDWLGFRNTRVWKCGNTGQVASVVIEKPHGGNFLSLVDGGFDLQYAPLLLGREGRGEVLFCQLDVTGRTTPDPAADRLHANLLNWLASASPTETAGVARYVGDEAGEDLLRRMKVRYRKVAPAEAAGAGLLIVGPDAGESLGPYGEAIAAAVAAGARVLCLPQSADALHGWLPFEVETQKASLIAATFTDGPGLDGIGPAELHWRGRKTVLTIGVAGAPPKVVARTVHGRGAYYFCQISPTDWDYGDEYRVYLKRTHNRTATLLGRLLALAGAGFDGPLVTNWSRPVPPNVDLAGPWQLLTDPQGKLTIEGLDRAEGWRELRTPGSWEDQLPDQKSYDGIAWYKRTFEWRGPVDRPAELRLGSIDDEDWTYLNGRLVGHIGQDTNPDDYWSAKRSYALPPGTLRLGANSLVVKVRDLRQAGGIVSGPLAAATPPRWLSSWYLDTPAKLDDPYRYNRW